MIAIHVHYEFLEMFKSIWENNYAKGFIISLPLSIIAAIVITVVGILISQLDNSGESTFNTFRMWDKSIIGLGSVLVFFITHSVLAIKFSLRSYSDYERYDFYAHADGKQGTFWLFFHEIEELKSIYIGYIWGGIVCFSIVIYIHSLLISKELNVLVVLVLPVALIFMVGISGAFAIQAPIEYAKYRRRKFMEYVKSQEKNSE